MNREQIQAFLNENTVAILATTDGQRPYVRSVWTVKTDENGVIFHTGRMRELYAQLVNNPAVEMCFLNKDRTVQVRVSGTARSLEDRQFKNELADQRPFLRAIEQKTGSLDFLAVFRLENCTATVWTMETNHQPKEYIRL